MTVLRGGGREWTGREPRKAESQWRNPKCVEMAAAKEKCARKTVTCWTAALGLAMHRGTRGENEPVGAYERRCDGARRRATVRVGRRRVVGEGDRPGKGVRRAVRGSSQRRRAGCGTVVRDSLGGRPKWGAEAGQAAGGDRGARGRIYVADGADETAELDL